MTTEAQRTYTEWIGGVLKTFPSPFAGMAPLLDIFQWTDGQRMIGHVVVPSGTVHLSIVESLREEIERPMFGEPRAPARVSLRTRGRERRVLGAPSRARGGEATDRDRGLSACKRPRSVGDSGVRVGGAGVVMHRESSPKQVGPLPLKALYSLQELADASDLDRRRVERLFALLGVITLRVGKCTLVPLSELEEKAWPFWESIVRTERLRQQPKPLPKVF